LNLEYDELLSIFGFKSNLHCYNEVTTLFHEFGHALQHMLTQESCGQGLTLVHFSAQREHFMSHVLGCFAGLSDKNGSG